MCVTPQQSNPYHPLPPPSKKKGKRKIKWRKMKRWDLTGHVLFVLAEEIEICSFKTTIEWSSGNICRILVTHFWDSWARFPFIQPLPLCVTCCTKYLSLWSEIQKIHYDRDTVLNTKCDTVLLYKFRGCSHRWFEQAKVTSLHGGPTTSGLKSFSHFNWYRIRKS